MAKKKQAPAPPPPKKKVEPPTEEGLPPWMATFADMVTLLLCFFVLLLSFAQHDVNKFRTLMGSIKDAFGIQVKRPDAEHVAFSPTKYERKDVEMTQENKEILGLAVQIKSLIELDDKLKKVTDVATDERGVVIRVKNDFLFQPGSATLQEGAAPLFDDAIQLLKDYNFELTVRGHTDDQTYPSNLYPSNWELSSSRAAAVLRFMKENGGISASRLKAVGYADSQPLVPNNSEANRELNRRMELYFHRPGTKSW